MRYLIKFSYDGSCYSGFQRQPKKNTIQGEIEKALQKINNGKKVNLVASGRTDKGVHAYNQSAHFDLDITITTNKLKRAINSNIGEDIHVNSVLEVSDSFHARYMVKSKKYMYIINLGEYNPIERNYVYQYNYILDIKSIKKGLKYFIGTHDFRSFVTENSNKSNCIRTIEVAKVEYDKYDNNKLVFTFEGDGFMRYQIRNMVGLLIKVGQNKIPSGAVLEILNRCDRKKDGVTAPSCGLYLVDVKYLTKYLKNA